MTNEKQIEGMRLSDMREAQRYVAAKKSYVRHDYTCDNGQLAQIIIPREATKDDLCALREMLEVLIKRKFKESEGTE